MTDAVAPDRDQADGARRARRRGVAALIAAFALGAFAGLGAAPLLRPPQAPLPPSLDALGLTAAQRARIEAIIVRHGPEVEAALGDARPRLRAVQERVADQIEAELTPEQRARFRRDRARRPPPTP